MVPGAEQAQTALATHTTEIALSDLSAAGGHWVQLIPAGRFSARDGRGPFDAGGEAELKAILENTLALAGRTELVVDYDHQTLFGARDGVGGQARAAGWVKKMEVRASGIWGLVEWTAAAAEAIRKREYRYLSPVILSHKTSGAVLAIRMTTLTNTPALDLEQVAAAASFTTQGTNMEKIIAALGLAAGSTEDAVLAKLNAFATSVSAIAVAAGLPATAVPADVKAAAVLAFSDRKAFAVAAGQAENATADVVVSAMKSAAGAPDPSKWVPIAAVTELQTQFKALQDKIGGDKAEAVVLKAIADGKLTPALKQWGLDLAAKDIAQFEAFTAGAPTLTAPQLTTPKRKTGDAAVLDAEQTAVATALGIDHAAYAKTISAEQETL